MLNRLYGKAGEVMYTVLIAEDDETIRRELELLLTKYGYAVESADDFGNIVEWALSRTAHLLLLDVNLPFYDGFYVCREIRKRASLPIIMVTSRDADVDELMGMNLGADDFVRKPYNIHVLLARIEGVLRRTAAAPADDTLSVAGLALNINSGVVTCEGRTSELTKNEQRILRLLMKNRGKILSRDELMLELWQSDEFVDDNTLTVNIGRLRKKLEEIGAEGVIQTRRGQGYIL